jgi:putative ABC transport system ATP-binding protein
MVLEATAVCREFDSAAGTVTALDDVDMTVSEGEFVTVVGPSGSGKSTLLAILGLLDVPTAGRVRLDGVDTGSYSRRERTAVRKERIGFVFQDYGLIPTLTAVENVAAPRLLDADPAATERRAAELLGAVGLGDRTGHYPEELSGGQRQRVSVARSLINDPSVVLADEPTGNLDRDTGKQVFETLLSVTDDDTTVVAVTHDQYLSKFSDRSIRLVDGRVVDTQDTLGRAEHGGDTE